MTFLGPCPESIRGRYFSKFVVCSQRAICTGTYSVVFLTDGPHYPSGRLLSVCPFFFSGFQPVTRLLSARLTPPPLVVSLITFPLLKDYAWLSLIQTPPCRPPIIFCYLLMPPRVFPAVSNYVRNPSLLQMRIPL